MRPEYHLLWTHFGGFHLHLLVFPFVYQFYPKIKALVYSSFANDYVKRISASFLKLEANWLGQNVNVFNFELQQYLDLCTLQLCNPWQHALLNCIRKYLRLKLCTLWYAIFYIFSWSYALFWGMHFSLKLCIFKV